MMQNIVKPSDNMAPFVNSMMSAWLREFADARARREFAAMDALKRSLGPQVKIYQEPKAVTVQWLNMFWTWEY